MNILQIKVGGEEYERGKTFDNFLTQEVQFFPIFTPNFAKFCNVYPKKVQILTIFLQKMLILTFFPQKSAIFDNFPL